MENQPQTGIPAETSRISAIIAIWAKTRQTEEIQTVMTVSPGQTDTIQIADHTTRVVVAQICTTVHEVGIGVRMRRISLISCLENLEIIILGLVEQEIANMTAKKWNTPINDTPPCSMGMVIDMARWKGQLRFKIIFSDD